MQTAGLGLCRNRHGNQFHTRIHIPKDLIRLVGRAEMRVSLGTEARRYAISSARSIHARKITAFDELRALMNSRKTDPTPEQQEEARKCLLEHMRGQLARQALKYPPEHDSQGDAQEVDRERELDVQIAALDALAENVRSTEFVHARRFHEIVGSSDPGLEAFKLTTAQVSDAAEITQLRVGLARIESESRARGRELEKTRELLQDAVRSGVPQVAELPEVRMSELLAAFRDAPEFQKKGARTNGQYVAEVERFIRAMGDMFIKDISGETMRAFLDVEKNLPPNINKVKKFAGLSLQEIAQLNDAEDSEVVELATALQRITRIGTVFNWALEDSDGNERWGFQRLRNPSPCYKFEKKFLTAEEEKMLDDGEHTRRAFSDEDLRKLFTGQMKEGKGRAEIGYGYGAMRFKKRYQYWLPLMALFTGARANELAQLRLSDIKDEEGIPCLDFNEAPDTDGERRKSLNTKTSRRVIPIHPKLLELGFLDYVQQLKQSGHWCLFQEMSPQDASGRRPVYNSQMTNWFYRYRKDCDVVKNVEGKPVFHSFRHTAATRLENAGVPVQRFRGILGHLQDNESMATYAKLNMVGLREEMAKMVFPADVLEGLPRWGDVEFTESPPQPVTLQIAPTRLSKARGRQVTKHPVAA